MKWIFLLADAIVFEMPWRRWKILISLHDWKKEGEKTAVKRSGRRKPKAPRKETEAEKLLKFLKSCEN